MSNRQSSKRLCSFPLVSRMWNCKRPTSSRISIIPDTAAVKHHTSTQIHNVYLSTEESSKPRAKIHTNYVSCFFFLPTSIQQAFFFKYTFKGFQEVTITMHKYVKTMYKCRQIIDNSIRLEKGAKNSIYINIYFYFKCI